MLKTNYQMNLVHASWIKVKDHLGNKATGPMQSKVTIYLPELDGSFVSCPQQESTKTMVKYRVLPCNRKFILIVSVWTELSSHGLNDVVSANLFSLISTLVLLRVPAHPCNFS